MRTALFVLALGAACDRPAARGERCANDAECAAGNLCHEGRCGAKARVEAARLREIRADVEKARQSAEAIAERVDEAAEILDRSLERPDGGETGGGVRSVGGAEKVGEHTKVDREDYQRNAVGR